MKVDVEFYSQINRPEKVYFKYGRKKLVNDAGYISPKKKIESLIMAGQRLAQYRAEAYDFEGDEIDENFNDPTRSPGFDMADAFQIKLATERRMSERNKEKALKNAPGTTENGSGEEKGSEVPAEGKNPV